jgi:hypothetical protein
MSVQTFWVLYRKCRVCDAETGQSCRSLSGTIVGGRPDGIETKLAEPHKSRLPKKGLIMPDKNTGGRDDKAPTTGSNTTQKRDDKATVDGKAVDPKRPHTDR